MQLRSLILLAVLAFAGPTAWSHGDQKHIVGTIEKISADAVVVKTSAGKSVEVKLVSKTTFLQKDGKDAKLSDLMVGDRVVIHATPHGDTLEANAIKFAKPGDTLHARAKSGKR